MGILTKTIVSKLSNFSYIFRFAIQLVLGFALGANMYFIPGRVKVTIHNRRGSNPQ